jgi:hypothetical protein
VTHDDGLGLEAADDPGVVGDDVVDAVTGDAIGLLPRLFDRVCVARLAGSDRRVARLPEAVDPRAPRVGVQPEPVDEDNRSSLWGHQPLLTQAKFGFAQCFRGPTRHRRVRGNA